MTDKENIEQAVEAYGETYDGNISYDIGKAFRKGVQYRDESPSEKVLALVEALEKIRDRYSRSHEDISYGIAREALAAWNAK